MVRRLRVVVSATFAFVAIAIAMAWFRSYLVIDKAILSVGKSTYYVVSQKGRLTLGVSKRGVSADGWTTEPRWGFRDIPIIPSGIRWTRPGVLRYWQLVVASGFLAVLPWMRSRFSVRTL